MAPGVDSLYPPPPAPPGDSPRPPAGYRLAVAHAVGALALFAAGYASILVLALALLGYVGSWWWVLSRSNPAMGVLLSPAVALASVPALAALTAWLGARTPVDPALVPITRAEQPTLFAFLDRLCDEVRAPRPSRVWIDHKVNASVFFRASIWMRSPRDLVIGLGLVDALGLSEFKAVLAHELGHFSQRAIVLVGLVHRARLLADATARGGAPWLARALARSRGWHPPLSLLPDLAHVLCALTAAPLSISWTTVGSTYARLSRLMEHAADDVAVHAAGSTSLVHAITRLDFADSCMAALHDDLAFAHEHGLRTDDLFAHTASTAAALRDLYHDPALGLPTDTRRLNPWTSGSHPSDAERAERAASLALDTPPEQRPAWDLVGQAAELRRRVTAAITPPGEERPDAASVEAFLTRERLASRLDATYRGIYRARPLALGSPDEIASRARTGGSDLTALRASLAALHGASFQSRMDAHERVVEELRALDVSDAPGRAEELRRQLVAHHEWVAAHDRDVVDAHARAAAMLGDVVLDGLLVRYRAQRGIQGVREVLAIARAALRRGGEVAAPHARIGLARALELADEVLLPDLQHITPGESLGSILRPRLDDARARDVGLDATLTLLSRRAARVDTKNVSSLIRAHEEIACTWELAFDPSRHDSL